MRNDQNRFPIWIGGILLALILILISTSSGSVNNRALVQHFAPRPIDPNAPTAQSFQLPQVHLPDLPLDLRHTITSLRDRFTGGERVPALTPVATGPRIRVEVQDVQRSDDRVRITGSIANISDAPLAIPTGTFSFRDSAGTTYATSADSITIQPGQSTPFDLAVPLPAGRGLTLIVVLPPDPPTEQMLVVEPT